MSGSQQRRKQPHYATRVGFSISLTAEQVEMLDTLAGAELRSYNNYCAALIWRHLNDEIARRKQGESHA